MKRTNLPSLINKEYLLSIKNKLKKRSPTYNFNIFSFLKDHTTFLIVLFLIVLICLWRYKLNSRGAFNTTKNKIQQIQQKSAISLKDSLKNIKKKNDQLNKPKFAIANDKKKFTKIEHLPKQKFKPENNVKELPALLPANSEAYFGATF
jgi:hypothetical protein